MMTCFFALFVPSASISTDFVFGSESAPPFRPSELPHEVIHGAEAARSEVGTVRAHVIRGVSTSVAFHRNWSVSAVLDAAT